MTANMTRVACLLLVFGLVCAATFAVWLKLQTPTTGIDDANIFLVYAQNLSAGEGFVFNQGGERVEGFTSLAWVLICTAAYWARSPEGLLLLINITLVTLTIGCCLTTSTFRRSSNAGAFSLPWAAIFVALLLSDYNHVMWNTITLMETALWTALLTLSAVVVLNDAVDRMHVFGLAAIVALMVVTRPEALVWAPLMIFFFYARRRSLLGHTSAFRSAIPSLLAYALTAGLLTIFRVWYFGYPLPNTYYAKISPSLTYRISQGSQYLWAYLSSGPVPLTCSLAAAFLIFHLLRVRLQDMRSGALGLMAMAGLMLPVYLGGDHFGGFRFYQPIYPILLLTLVHSLRFIAPQYVAPGSGRSAGRALTIAAVALGGWFLVTRIADWRNFDREAVLRREFTIAELGRDRGRHADALFAGLESRPSIGTITVGGLKYAYSGEVIDLMGLNNTRMAHNSGTRVGIRSHAAFETRTFYELHPTLLLPLVQYSELAVQATRIWFVDVALKGLVDEKPFRDKYRLAEVRRATPAGTVGIAGWYDRDFLSQLARSKAFQIIEPQERPE